MSQQKTHAPVMLTQLNIRDGPKAYVTRGDEVILKELYRLHVW